MGQWKREWMESSNRGIGYLMSDEGQGDKGSTASHKFRLDANGT